jgi:hypothetical protein
MHLESSQNQERPGFDYIGTDMFRRCMRFEPSGERSQCLQELNCVQ